MHGNATLSSPAIGATSSPSLRFEDRPECIPLVWALPNEGFEAVHDPLHQILFGFTIWPRQRGLEMDVVTARRLHVLVSRHERCAGLQRQRSRAGRDYRTPPEEADLDSGPLLLVANQADHAVRRQRLDDLAHGGPADQ